MTSHLGWMVVFAGCVAAVFSVLMRDEPREQRQLAGRIFAGLVAGAYVLGWLMYLAFR
jgi:hypothetical protein